ncbi:hypothetical protein B0A49_04202 [Cryomyces minteri]|uniref:Uncharacterized protein n=1 Tax=Cryomyces minteri TaxID=331657 RepID=A0A4U0XPX7_9PEZI|nr:hypothetical protein B0A49_04202 [Cryomyces minteri]
MLLSVLTGDSPVAHHQHYELSLPAPATPERAGAPPKRDPVTPVRPSALRSASSPGIVKGSRVLVFAEPEYQYASSVEMPEPDSPVSASSDGRQRKRASRSKTSYHLAHPPPTKASRQKLHIRPKVLLQLQKISTSSRPVPAFEVISSATFSPKLGRAISKVFGAKHGLCPNDLVIVRGDEYGRAAEENTEEDVSYARDVVGIICKGRGDDRRAPQQAKLCVADGSEWEATTLPNGSYEFTQPDGHGLAKTARWVLRNTAGHKRTATVQNGSSAIGTVDGKKFNFSTISPLSRRHPVVASLTPETIDIFDHYNMPSPSHSTQPPVSPTQTPSTVRSETHSYMDCNDLGNPLPIQTDEQLRNMIVASGIWVALREGWSPNFDPAATFSSPIFRSPTSAGRPSALKRTSSVPPDPKVTSSRPTTPDVPNNRRSLHNISGSVKGCILRSGSQVLHHHHHHHQSESATTSASTSHSDGTRSVPLTTRSRRANSTGTILMHRATSIRNRNRTATWRPDLVPVSRPLHESHLARIPPPHPDSSDNPLEEAAPHPSLPDLSTTYGDVTADPTPLTTPTPTPRRRNTNIEKQTRSAYYPNPSERSDALPLAPDTNASISPKRESASTGVSTLADVPKPALVDKKEKSGKWKALLSLFRKKNVK